MTDNAQPSSENNSRPTRKSNASILRDIDVLRHGLPGYLDKVELGELVISLEEALPVREQIKVIVRNEVQRLEREVRGIVLDCQQGDSGGMHQVTIELYTRLTPLDVSMLRQGLGSEAPSSQSKWL